MWCVPPEGIVGPVGTACARSSVPCHPPRGGNPAGSIREPRGFASRPCKRFAFDTLGLAHRVSGTTQGVFSSWTNVRAFAPGFYAGRVLARRLLILLAVL